MKFRRLLFFLFFLSGFSALVYEVVWARQLALVFGYTVYAVSAILMIFFAGLALGSLVFGYLVDKLASRKKLNAKPYALNALFIYALLELGIGFYAAVTPWIFKLIENLQISLGEASSGFSIFTFILCFLGLILPTTLMGGTLPVIARFLVFNEEEKGQVMGNLYGLNTLGGVTGAFLAGFILIAYLGVKETIWLAAGINLVIGVAVILASRGKRLPARLPSGTAGKAGLAFRESFSQRLTPNAQRPEIGAKRYTLYPVLLAFAASGFAALALEVLWTRVLILVFGSSTYSFTIILAVFLLGIALGSLLASRFLVSRKNLIVWFAFLEIFLGAGVIMITPFLEKLPLFFLNLYKDNFVSNLWVSSLTCFLMILPLTILMGMIFPLAAKILTPNFKKLGQDLGRLYSVNTIGGILGSFIAGFFLIAYLGLQKGILLSGFLYALAGLLVLFTAKIGWKVRLLGLLAVVLIGISSFFLPDWNRRILSSGVFMYSREYQEEGPGALIKEENILFYEEGLSANITVERDGQTLLLRINGKVDASTSTDLPTEILCGHLPLLFHPNPQKVLVIGLGSGITLGAVEQHGVDKIDMVEIEPAVVEAAQFFDDYNHHAFGDERVRTIVNDGRHFLLTTSNKYDIITSVPSNPWVKGNANLFTQEYFELAKEHLEEGGIFLQWIQYYFLDSESLKTVLATFQSVYPEMTVWSPLVGNDLLLVGTKESLKIDYATLERKFENEKISQDLGRIGVSKGSQIIGLYLFGGQKVKEMASGVRLHTDNHPFLEFAAPLTLGKETVGENSKMMLPVLDEPYYLIVNLSPEEKKKIETNFGLREEVLQGKIALTTGGNPQEALSHFLRALEVDPGRKSIKDRVTQIYFDLAKIAYLQNDFGEAKKFLLKVIELDASHFRAHLNLGAIYYQEGNFGQAAQEWAIAMELEPESPEVKKNLELLEKVMNK